ncbi:MAG: hypothetical protein ABSF54_21275 [Bryobacteraceae bacterium]
MFSLFAGQLIPSATLTNTAAHNGIKPPAVIQTLAIVITEGLIRQDTGKMVRLYTDTRAMDTALQETPEVFQAVGLGFAAHTLNRVVDHFVLKFVETFIRFQRIGKDRGPGQNVIAYLRAARRLAAPFQDAHDGGFVLTARA